MNAVQDQKTLDFIEKAIKIHGNKYDYSKTTYKGYHDELTYWCTIHGQQTQKAGDHLRSKFGCQECSKEQKDKGTKTTEEWINEARTVHGNKYDYSVSSYVNKRTKINIKCPKHNKIFSQFAGSHLQGYGCPDCGIQQSKSSKIKSKKISSINNFTKSDKSRKTLFTLLKQFVEVHGDRFNYEKVNYVNDRCKINIFCKKCNQYFQQTPSSHLQGHGCPSCAGRIDTTRWIKKAQEIHGDKYDYSKSIYTNIKTPIIISCKKHGDFSILPQKHILRKQGCKECGKIVLRERFLKGKKIFIKEAMLVHGGKYDYSKVVYVNNKVPIEIICQKHGSFWQSPSKHTSRGDGCPTCMFENRLTDFTDVVVKSISIHKEAYDYSKAFIKILDGKTYLQNIKCNNGHGYFNQRLDGHLNGNGCQKCRETRGEKAIREWLTNNKIEFFSQALANHYFANSLFVTDIKRTEYDFLLPKQKIIIEFDGEQHFTYIDFHGKGTQKSYNEWLASIKRDDLKDELAHNSGYKVIRIPFWERDNIEDILEQLLIKKDSAVFTRYSLQSNRFRYEMIYLIGIKNEDEWEHYFNNLNDEDL